MQLSNVELATFFDQMAMILHSGIPAIEGIAIMREDTSSKEGREILDTLYKTMEETGFYTPPSRTPMYFPPTPVNL